METLRKRVVAKALLLQKVRLVARYFVQLTLNFFIVVVLWSGCFVAWIAILTRGRVDSYTWTDCKLGYFLFYFGDITHQRY